MGYYGTMEINLEIKLIVFVERITDGYFVKAGDAETDPKDKEIQRLPDAAK